MPCVELRNDVLAQPVNGDITKSSPLPSLLQTPAGLAIIELQGTIHGPFQLVGDGNNDTETGKTSPIGRVEFPLYSSQDPGEGKWMKKVYLYVGKHQRLTGEIKKLAKPLAVIRKCDENEGDAENSTEELQIVDVVKFKLLFSSRPEPVGE